MSTSGRLAIVALAAALIAAQPATAQVLYTINGQPAPDNITLYMLSNGFPSGDYWYKNGYWGVMTQFGPSRPMGYINPNSAPGGSGNGATTCGAAGCITTDGEGHADIGH